MSQTYSPATARAMLARAYGEEVRPCHGDCSRALCPDCPARYGPGIGAVGYALNVAENGDGPVPAPPLRRGTRVPVVDERRIVPPARRRMRAEDRAAWWLALSVVGFVAAVVVAQWLAPMFTGGR